MKQSHLWVRRMACFLLFLWTPLSTGFVMNLSWVRQAPEIQDNMDKFRNMKISADHLSGYRNWSKKDYHQLAKDFLFYGGELRTESAHLSACSWYRFLFSENKADSYGRAWKMAWGDVQCFPVAEDTTGREKITYEDSWGMSRNYGGNRVHEGTDLMASTQKRGYFSVVSVSDGVVEKKGWLKLGGYRLGIRSPGGAYFYYAHLAGYADGLEEGTTVKAGQIIGQMGDSGYGSEGTVGKFAVHLHFGIYIKIAGKEVSVNPYPILQAVERIKSFETALSTDTFL